MCLAWVRVRDYRSVHDSGDIEIEDRKTLFVGEWSRQDGCLKAIERIKAPTDSGEFSPLKDYPRSRYTEVQRG